MWQSAQKKQHPRKQSRSTCASSIIQGLGCDESHHARAIAEFTTGEVIVMSKWWSGMPKLRAYMGMMDVRFYIDADRHGHGCHMLSWRAAGAPVFTLAYRGRVGFSLYSKMPAPAASPP